ncbi:MAG: LysR substrate-binding domain-containing protein [Pseudomonadales bacterium]|nr:LysR substrate-binding domain-containing protein [Pseudomonadales bacterium]
MLKQPKPPPIQYLTAFEAAARLSSFKAAAGELNITASAVSQQIKSLEEYLGLSLFERGARGISLSNKGTAFYEVAQQTIATYQSTYTTFCREFESKTIRITMETYIANEFVIPELNNFSETHPNINLVLETSMEVRNLTGPTIDCALRLGVPPWPECEAKLLWDVRSNLIVSPTYFKQHPSFTVDNFDEHTLIHTRTDINDWQRVKDIFGIEKDPAKEFYFSSYSAAIKAAEEGLGVAIGLIPTVGEKLQDGRLVAYSAQHFPIEENYYLVARKGLLNEAEYLSLYDWILTLIESNT